jgi:c-di-GMP-binding flagellar brake protein YcgR
MAPGLKMKTPKKVLERRRAVRIVESLPFKLGHDHFEIEAISLNISATGAMCVVDTDIKLMTQLSLGVSLPNGSKSQRLVAKGVVVRKDRDPRTGKFLIAVFFSDLKPKDKKLLKEFIDGRLKRD